jgi:hypothetical protein
MLDPTDIVYWRLMDRITRWLNIPPIIQRISLPRAVLKTDYRLWVDPVIWHSRNTDAITQSIYRYFGTRPVAVAPKPDDNILPTRGLFITSKHDIIYEDIQWPGNVPPQLFYSAHCLQRIHHCHVIILFHYYSKTPSDLCNALGLHVRSCSRIKTSWDQAKRYIFAQATQTLSDIVNHRAALGWCDFTRAVSRTSILSMEKYSYGFPALFDHESPRCGRYSIPLYTPRIVDITVITHIFQAEYYKARALMAVAADYHGECVVHFPLVDQTIVIAPITATFIVLS